MGKRSIACGIVGCLGIACLVVLGCGKGSPPDESGPLSASLAEKARFITIPELFGDLDRPPVRFDHDKHTKALEAEGCLPCHEEDDGDFLFVYKNIEEQTDRDDLMDVYHDNCIDCHTERRKQGEDSGPVTCGECHIVERTHEEP